MTYMLFAADEGDINTIIGGIAPDWGPFGSLGNEAKVMIEVVMAVAILICLGIAIWGRPNSASAPRPSGTPSARNRARA
ncbi:hypothetical protein GCM10020295_45030 [Streptomyces cinereospinus]